MKPDGHRMREASCPVCSKTFAQYERDGRPKTCSRTCARKLDAQRNGGHSHNFKGGRWTINSGYVKVLRKEHPRADTAGYVLEHVLVMEESLGRHLEPHERVHHRNGRRDDNRVENLELWKHKDPPGVRASDYHCAGCRCSELASARDAS